MTVPVERDRRPRNTFFNIAQPTTLSDARRGLGGRDGGNAVGFVDKDQRDPNAEEEEEACDV